MTQYLSVDTSLDVTKQIKKSINAINKTLNSDNRNYYDYLLMQISLDRISRNVDDLVYFVKKQLDNYELNNTCKTCNSQYIDGYCSNDNCLYSLSFKLLLEKITN